MRQWESALHGQAGSGPASSRPTASGSPAGRQHQVARDHHSQMSIRWPVSTIRISVGRQLIFYLENSNLRPVARQRECATARRPTSGLRPQPNKFCARPSYILICAPAV